MKDSEVLYFNVAMAVIPIGGIAAILTGLIDMQFKHGREMGEIKVSVGLLSHFIYLLIIMFAPV